MLEKRETKISSGLNGADICYRRFSSFANRQQITHATAADIPPKLSNTKDAKEKQERLEGVLSFPVQAKKSRTTYRKTIATEFVPPDFEISLECSEVMPFSADPVTFASVALSPGASVDGDGDGATGLSKIENTIAEMAFMRN